MQKGLIISDDIKKYKKEIKDKLSSIYLLHFSTEIDILSKAIISGDVRFVAFDPDALHINFIEVFNRIKSLYEQITVFLISKFTISIKVVKTIEHFISYTINEAFCLEEELNIFIDILSKLPNRKKSKKESIKMVYSSLIGKSENTEDLRLFASKVARSESTILLLGETGCGKSSVAQLIHKLSDRSDKRFVSVDIGSIPEQLVESILFGSKRGSYTGAYEDRKGLIEEANEGTLFLDEIENMSLEMQMKFLKVLETHKIRAVGENNEKYINFRLICASNRNLNEMIKEGIFREDLYYRINILRFEIQALRERKKDIEDLSRFYAKKLNVRISSEAILKLENAPLKGNVRELFCVIERAAVKALPLQIIYPKHIVFDL